MSTEWVQFGTQKMLVPGAVDAVDLNMLVARRGGVRGDDVTVEGEHGVLPRRRVRAVWDFVVAFDVSGDATLAGAPRPSGTTARVQARKNVHALVDAIVAPYPSSTTIPFVHHDEDGDEWDAEVIVLAPATSSPGSPHRGEVIRLVLDVRVPSGLLLPVEAAAS